MQTAPTATERFVPLRQSASRLGLPIAWLKSEAEAGRVPHLRVSRRLLFNLEAVEAVLLKRAEHHRTAEGDPHVMPRAFQ